MVRRRFALLILGFLIVAPANAGSGSPPYCAATTLSVLESPDRVAALGADYIAKRIEAEGLQKLGLGEFPIFDPVLDSYGERLAHLDPSIKLALSDLISVANHHPDKISGPWTKFLQDIGLPLFESALSRRVTYGLHGALTEKFVRFEDEAIRQIQTELLADFEATGWTASESVGENAKKAVDALLTNYNQLTPETRYLLKNEASVLSIAGYRESERTILVEMIKRYTTSRDKLAGVYEKHLSEAVREQTPPLLRFNAAKAVFYGSPDLAKEKFDSGLIAWLLNYDGPDSAYFKRELRRFF